MNGFFKKYTKPSTVVLVLWLFAMLCIPGTLIPQDKGGDFYLLKYGNFWGGLMLNMGVDRFYTSPLFIAGEIGFFVFLLISAGILIRNRKEIAGGVWIATAFLGFALLFAGGLVSGLLGWEETITLKPGEKTKSEKGEFSLKLNDFSISFNERKKVIGYISHVEIETPQGTRKGKIVLNRPLKVGDAGIFQSGWKYEGIEIIVISQNPRGHKDKNPDQVDSKNQSNREEYKAILPLNERGEFSSHHEDRRIPLEKKGYFLCFNKFYPDYQLSKAGKSSLLPSSSAVELSLESPWGTKNYLLREKEGVKIEGYEVRFNKIFLSSELLVRKDPGFPLILTGFGLIMAGMVVSLYFFPKSGKGE